MPMSEMIRSKWFSELSCNALRAELAVATSKPACLRKSAIISVTSATSSTIKIRLGSDGRRALPVTRFFDDRLAGDLTNALLGVLGRTSFDLAASLTRANRDRVPDTRVLADTVIRARG